MWSLVHWLEGLEAWHQETESLESCQSNQDESRRKPRFKGHFRGSRDEIIIVTVLLAWGPKWGHISFQICGPEGQPVLPCPLLWWSCGTPPPARLVMRMGSVAASLFLPLLWTPLLSLPELSEDGHFTLFTSILVYSILFFDSVSKMVQNSRQDRKSVRHPFNPHPTCTGNHQF